MNYDVFLSYSRQDEKFVLTFRDFLEKKGIRCWRDKDNIGLGNWAEKIVDAIDNVPIVILIFSANAQNSENVLKELTLAAQKQCLLIPVRIEDIKPEKAFRYHLVTPNVIDILENQLDRHNYVAEKIKEHIDLIRKRENKEMIVSDSNNVSNETTLIRVLRMAYEDDQITDIERNTINNLIKDLCISIERAKEIEAKVRAERTEASISSRETVIKNEPIDIENSVWPDAGVKFLKSLKDILDQTQLSFIPVEISSDEDIAEDLEIFWFIDDTYYFAVWLDNKRLDKVNLRWGYCSSYEKRDPLFRKTADAFCRNEAWLNDDGDVLIDGDIYEFNSEEGYLGFETSQRKTILSLSDPALVEVIANKIKVFSQSIWPIIIENKKK